MKEHVFLESTAALTSVINIQDVYWEKSDKSPLANHLFNELKQEENWSFLLLSSSGTLFYTATAKLTKN